MNRRSKAHRVPSPTDPDPLHPLRSTGAAVPSDRGGQTLHAAPTADEAVAATPLPPGSDHSTIVAVLTARMGVLLGSTYRYTPPVMEIEATRASFLAYEPPGESPDGEDSDHLSREQGVTCGWLPQPPSAEDEKGWRRWCAMIEAYAAHVRALLPPDHPEACRFVPRVDPRPACVPPLEPWLLAAGRERIGALHAEVLRRYHAHPWFARDRDTPAALLRVRGRVTKRREMEDKRPWDLTGDPMAQLEAVLVRCAPHWWYRVVVERGAVPLAALDSALADWRDAIDRAPAAELYATPISSTV